MSSAVLDDFFPESLFSPLPALCCSPCGKGCAANGNNRGTPHLVLTCRGHVKRRFTRRVLEVAHLLQLPEGGCLFHQRSNHVHSAPLARGQERRGPATCFFEQVGLL